MNSEVKRNIQEMEMFKEIEKSIIEEEESKPKKKEITGIIFLDDLKKELNQS
jgi:hypothetical protein